MNRYPMVFAPRSWSPALNPLAVRLLRPLRKRRLRVHVQLNDVAVQGTEHLRESLASGQQILITPNHPSHADPFAIYEACEQAGTSCHIMAAWHVFAKSSRLMRKCLQWHGCFSIDRESNDLTAFRDAVQVLKNRREPLVIFPEGDIYHCNERVTPFREGAAAIAIAAARRSDRPTVILPTAIRYRFAGDPTPHLEQTVCELEKRILWRPRPELPLVERVRSVGDAVLGLKEIEFYGYSLNGPLPKRLQKLIEFILTQLEERYQLEPTGTPPKRVKRLRQAILTKLHDRQTASEERAKLRQQLDDAFTVLQLFSYPGNYLDDASPSIERIAETVDKLEEDVLQVKTATIRGPRDVTIIFGEPIAVSTAKSRDATLALTARIEEKVAEMVSTASSAGSSATADPSADSSIRIG